MKLLLDTSSDVNAKTFDGQTALIRAAVNGNEKIVKLLLEKSADVSAVYNGKTAYDWASYEGYPDISQLILEHSN